MQSLCDTMILLLIFLKHSHKLTIIVVLLRNAAWWTPLDAASYKGHSKVVQVLIEAGADVNPTDKQLTTPLHLAAKEGHLNIVHILLNNGAQVCQRDINELSSLDMAIDNGHE